MEQNNVDCRENTLIARGSGIFDSTGSISAPIYRSATYVHPTLEYDKDSFYYSRCDTPTRRALEKLVASLEHGADAVAVSSGLAAMDVVIRLFSPGDRIIVSSDLYGGSYRLFNEFYTKYGLIFDFVDTWDAEALRKAVRPETKGFFIETPSNPMLRVTDIALVSKIAKKNDALVIVDNTFLSPLFQKPIDLGADIVIHSATKFLAGHHDVLAGIIVTTTEELRTKLNYYSYCIGNPLSADDAWLTIRGIETLSVRLERQQENARILAEYLEAVSEIKRVIYPGSKSHPDHELAKRQQRGFGSMLSFEIWDADKAPAILERFKLVYQAGSLGGVQSLICLPNASLQCPIPKELREQTGVSDALFRLSVGIEDVEDLIEDISQAIRI